MCMSTPRCTQKNLANSGTGSDDGVALALDDLHGLPKVNRRRQWRNALFAIAVLIMPCAVEDNVVVLPEVQLQTAKVQEAADVATVCLEVLW